MQYLDAISKMTEWSLFISGRTEIIARRNINNFRYANDTTLIAESKEQLKGLLIKVKEESEKS